MLTGFDWLRRSRTGAELLATLDCLAAPELPAGLPGPPPSALEGPCRRCWLYAREPHQDYCPFCRAVLRRAASRGDKSRRAIVVWGYVNQLPKYLPQRQGFYERNILGAYIQDEHRFLLTLYQRELKTWLQELALYHGAELKGLLQIFPTIGGGPDLGMGDLLCRVIQYEANFSMDRLRVQFYAAPYQVLRAGFRERQAQVTFELAEFLRLLELALVFRKILLPDQQEALYKLLNIAEAEEAAFYWGRFLGYLSQEAKDMLNAWQIRQWPKSQIELLYELLEYVDFFGAD